MKSRPLPVRSPHRGRLAGADAAAIHEAAGRRL